MELPTKRKSLRKRPNQSLQKIPKITPEIKLPKSKFLRKDLWVEIIDYLDTKSYFLIIPQINSFFYFLVKDYKNYKTTLKLSLNAYFSKSDNDKNIKILKNHNSLECITECQRLKKLELNLINREMTSELNLQPNLSLEDLFVSISSLSTIKILGININRNIELQIFSFLELLVNLEVLKLFFDRHSNTVCFTEDKFLKSFKVNSYSKIPLKKLSLKLCYNYSPYNEIEKIYESLDETNLEKISIKYKCRNSETFIIPIPLKSNCNLKCIKISSMIKFNNSYAENLCNYLANTQILEELQVSDSIIIAKVSFIKAILNNSSLRIFALNHYYSLNCVRFEINVQDACEIFDAVAKTSIENFSISVFINKA